MTFRNLTQKTPKGRNVHGTAGLCETASASFRAGGDKVPNIFLVFERDPMDVISRPSLDL
jgi:hypothetical protein